MLDFVGSRVREPDVAEAALNGLMQDRKTLPAKLFYDVEGCRLFGDITRLPEYYVTRTESALLSEMTAEFGALAPAGAALIEYGASREDKALMLLAAMRSPAAYVPIDVAGPALVELAARMEAGPVDVHPIVGDFLEELALPDQIDGLPVAGFFPGSTIGNLDPEEAAEFLHTARDTLMGRQRTGALFLVGVDLRKSPEILIPAYNDSAGVTAAFNKNLLVRLNREAAADFDLDGFEHEARWNDQASRIEMHLVSMRRQVVRVADQPVDFAQGESIHTENSYKHSVAGFHAVAARGGWRPRKVWTDGDELFSLHLLQAGDVT